MFRLISRQNTDKSHSNVTISVPKCQIIWQFPHFLLITQPNVSPTSNWSTGLQLTAHPTGCTMQQVGAMCLRLVLLYPSSFLLSRHVTVIHVSRCVLSTSVFVVKRCLKYSRFLVLLHLILWQKYTMYRRSSATNPEDSEIFT